MSHRRYASPLWSWFSANRKRRRATRATGGRGALPAASPESRVRRLKLEGLEERRVLATLYVDDAFVIAHDVAPSGISAGDTVTWDAGQPDQQTGLIFGTNAFNTIQDAINAAGAGDTIDVARGAYDVTTAINVNKSLTIDGPQAGVDPRPSAGSLRVAGSASEALIDGGNTSTSIFLISASNATINGFDVTNSTGPLVDTSSGASLSNVRILDNFVHHATNSSTGKGIRFQGVSDGIVSQNDLYDLRDSGVEIGSGAVGASTGCTVSNNEVHDLGAGLASNSALYAFATPFASNINVTFQNNLVYNFQGNDAIKVGAKNGADQALAGGSVIGNVVHDVGEDGITINASNTLVQGNEVYNSSSDNAALYVEHSNGNVTIENNNLHDNTAGVATILIGDGTTAPSGVVVTQNRIQNNLVNTLFFRDLGGANTVDASGNWWGTTNPAFVAAEALSTNPGKVDFTPWINSGVDVNPAVPGFQPDLSSVTVAPAALSPQFGVVGRIQEGVDLATTGGKVHVISGSYTENLNLTKNVDVALEGATLNGTAVLSSGTLSGTGVVSGAITVQSGGTLSPGGNSLAAADNGPLNVGNVTFNSGSKFFANLNGATAGTQYSQLVAAGAVNLTGATLDGATGFVPSVGQTFTLITPTGVGSVTGAFNGLPQGGLAQLGSVFYSTDYHGGAGSDVVLTATANAVPVISDLNLPPIVEGSGDTTITIHGTGFTNVSQVQVNGTPVATTFVSGTELQAVVPAADLVEQTTLTVNVVTPPPGGGASNDLPLDVVEPAIVGAGLTVNGFELAPNNTVTVATFTHGLGTEAAGQFAATIAWGDGTTSAGTVTKSGATYSISGS
ncbi:MAG TPA: right-handed parallel beta-helix repeat-containing protein, partial [Pirellulales bacterium]|nr:right-handed parallel beta-helix repeat-containing protein [Pirellulales bacterium]